LNKNNRKKIGLALGGGVVRGMAHIGVIAVLEEANIPVDYIAGTSAGSVIAVSYSAGLKAKELKDYALHFHWLRLIRPVWSSSGFFNFNKLSDWLIHELGNLDFSDLHIPCSVIATDMHEGVPVAIQEGKIAPAVQASCSMPGIVTPVEINGRYLGDGGVSDMLPVAVLRSMGADYVIAVDIFPFKLRQYLGPFGYLWAALEIMLERAGGGIDEADCLISPNLRGETYIRFSRREKLYELGRQATYEKLDSIKDALGQPKKTIK